MKCLIVLTALFGLSLCECDYFALFGQLERKEITVEEYTTRYTVCLNNDQNAPFYGHQPSCGFSPAVTQAVAVIDRQGTLNTDNGPINYHIEGVVSFTRVSDQLTKITAVFRGLDAFLADSDKFSIHVHERGEVTADCLATGGHFNPCGTEHSDDPTSANRHIGDVAKVTIPSDGVLVHVTQDTQVKLDGYLSVLGRGVTVHAGAGAARVGCATIAVSQWEGGDYHPSSTELAAGKL